MLLLVPKAVPPQKDTNCARWRVVLGDCHPARVFTSHCASINCVLLWSASGSSEPINTLGRVQRVFLGHLLFFNSTFGSLLWGGQSLVTDVRTKHCPVIFHDGRQAAEKQSSWLGTTVNHSLDAINVHGPPLQVPRFCGCYRNVLPARDVLVHGEYLQVWLG